MWLKTNISYTMVINMNLVLQSILIYQILYLDGDGERGSLVLLPNFANPSVTCSLCYHSHQRCDTIITMLLYQEHSKTFSLIKINIKKVNIHVAVFYNVCNKL